MKTLQDMTGDCLLMTFSDLLEWESKWKNPQTGEVREFEFQAMYVDFPHDHSRYANVGEYVKENKLNPAYANFPWGFYQVFCKDVWIGQARNKADMKDIARSHALKVLGGVS